MKDVMKTILVVDDTPANIDILIEILSDKYDVAVATDGASALESVNDNIPDLILLDIMMPGMDGYEVCTRLKQSEVTNSIPVIFISAMSEIKDEIKGFKVGAVDFITKPFSPLVVKHRVDSILKLEDKTKELASLAQKLSKYLSPQVYVSIFRGDQDVKIESKRKKMTIFFSDIANFTSTTEGMETEDLTDLLNSYLDEMSTIAIKHGGTIDKFIGDAILIFFGDPLSRGLEEDAKACVAMAIEMRERLKELQHLWYSKGIQNPFQVRSGIATGYCTVGNFGSKSRMDYTIIGSQVNISSRLESKAQPDQILISHETWALVNDEISCIKEGLINVKGISHPIQTYQVIDYKNNITDETNLLGVKQYAEPIKAMEITNKVKDAYIVFHENSGLETIAVTTDGNPVGIITRYQIINIFVDDLIKKDYMEKDLSALKIKDVIIVDHRWPLKQVVERFSLRTDSDLYDPILITEDEKLIGNIPAYKLIKQSIGDNNDFNS